MRLLLTGSSGLIGSALAPSLERAGHSVVRAVRRPATGPGQIRWDPASGRLEGATPGWEAIVHLAGASLAGGRWNAARKRAAADSRIAATRTLCTELARLEPPPSVVVAASAIGYYGDRGDAWLDEDSSRGTGFLAALAEAWEKACEPAARAGIRVVNLRLGLVLACGGGALPRMLLPFRLGLGGPLGSGRQFWSWITLDDAVAAIAHALARDQVRGPVNVVAPDPVRQRVFARALGRALGRPAVLPAPAVALRLLLGEMADALLLASARVRPSRLAASDFAWRHAGLEEALRHVLAAG